MGKKVDMGGTEGEEMKGKGREEGKGINREVLTMGKREKKKMKCSKARDRDGMGGQRERK